MSQNKSGISRGKSRMCLKDNSKIWLQVAELDGAGRRLGWGSRLGRVGQGAAKGGFGGRTCMSIHLNNSIKPLLGCLPMQENRYFSLQFFM